MPPSTMQINCRLAAYLALQLPFSLSLLSLLLLLAFAFLNTIDCRHRWLVFKN